MGLTVKNWDRYQHYKDRAPPWIKLATDTFQNYDFSRLHDASKLLAICIWTMASRSRTGEVPDDFDYLKSQGCLSGLVKVEHLNELITKGFLIRSEALADCLQLACSETEGETEEEESAEVPQTEPSTPPVLVFPCAGIPATWSLTKDQIAKWENLFPSVDVVRECRASLAWVEANPGRKKTPRGMPAFLVRWLGKANDRSPANGIQRPIQGVDPEVAASRARWAGR